MKPIISFVTPMKEKDFRVIALLKSIRFQNYPQNRIEIIIIDGGSNPEILQACKNYKVKIFFNPKQLAEGAGMGKDQGIWKSKGKYIVIAESDIELIGKDWIINMIRPLENNSEIFASVPRLFINKKDNVTNRYLSYLGVDPFAIYRSIEGQLELNNNIKKVHKQGYDILELNVKNPYCMGSNGFMFRKSLIKKVGDYAQDVEFIARLAKSGYTKFAVIDKSRIWHKNIKSMGDFLRKRIRWTRNYAKVYIREKKDFQWITDRREFFFYVLKNLVLIPAIITSVKNSIRYHDRAWFLHAPLLFLSTILNIYFTFTSKKMLTQIFKG